MYPNPYHRYPSILSYYSMPFRQYPAVRPKKFMDTALHMNELLSDAQLVTNRILRSAPFAGQLMEAAQKSNMAQIGRLLAGTGIKHTPRVFYSPDGLVLEFAHQTGHDPEPCCAIQMKMRWS
ncbi:hypothetical protein BpJC7_18770 [Weizmannia acidilactici]|uniref:Uncharacterized protein n=1 Tax=Weizmannia acidilactici TaxID=2607726 RepID=A0A5J4JNK5_9BACI|nr:hypothetical protein [Weizmannia acidilactici]GER68227.1 hypothetical protein BpJC4_26980 [Weizmannia acidilactici]GER70574.1 hypothetical protein BpJC7_18770 [Weizmannia acidilactici]GER73139.1 hypothetical protein BpPP18_12060 [Weizmannia acidilactici]